MRRLGYPARKEILIGDTVRFIDQGWNRLPCLSVISNCRSRCVLLCMNTVGGKSVLS